MVSNEHLTRQADIIPCDVAARTPVTIVGAGAIGSWVAMLLAKSGFTNLTVYDHDTVDAVNMSSQGYRFKDIGKAKVYALKDMLDDCVPTPLDANRFIPTKWSLNTHAAGILVLAVDDMAARKDIYNGVKRGMFMTTHVIDTRMGAEVAMLYTTKPHSEDWYEKTLYSNEDSVQERCTAKATIYTACALSSMVVQTIKQVACGEDYNKNIQWNIKEGSQELWKSKQNR